MTDYSEAVVYKIYKENTREIYIGSTHDEDKREQNHKSNCNNENYAGYNLKVYEFIRANGGYDNWKYEVLEIYPCDNDIQLRIREQYYYDLLNPELNSQRPFVSEEELKEEKRIYDAKYYEEHREERAKYYLEHQEESKVYQAKYREENRDERLKYKANFYQRNNQKHNCVCGGKYTTISKAIHCKTKKHITFIEKK